MLESENINLITHENISSSHLNWGGLHLNKGGDAALAHNLLKLYVMFHNVFSNINANLQNCREIDVNDIRQGGSGSLHDREQSQYLKIHSLNIFHMMTHFDELKLFIETNKPDIIGISEIKLDKTINDCDICVPGYRVICKDRNCYGGGVLMYLNESLNVKHRENLDFDIESINVEIKIDNYKPFLVTAIYRPPDKPVAYFNQIETLISSTDLEGKESILMGDLNCDSLCESNNTKIYEDCYSPLDFLS